MYPGKIVKCEKESTWNYLSIPKGFPASFDESYDLLQCLKDQGRCIYFVHGLGKKVALSELTLHVFEYI